MVRYPTLVAAGFAIFITTAAYAAPVSNEIAAEAGQPLTLNSARKMVADKLVTDHQMKMRVGRAEFDSNGNVKVEIVNLLGDPVSHVLVRATDGQITDAAAAKKRG